MGRKLKIVLVEDNAEDIAYTRRVLKHNDLIRDLIVATDGKGHWLPFRRSREMIPLISSSWTCSCPISAALICSP